MGDVLVVDDDPAIVEMVRAALDLEGIPSRSAADGRAALAAVETQRPAVILLDLNMPVMDGMQFCQALEEGPGRDDCAIVAMTASREVHRFREACAADDLLGKPFHLEDLYSVVARHRRRP